MGEAMPPINPVPPRVHELLRNLYEVNRRHVGELAATIRRLGGTPKAKQPTDLSSDESYLRFLSLRFLIPKLAREKELMIERYQNALRALPKAASSDVSDLLRIQMAEQAANVDELQASAEKAA
jgi:DNA-binding ferritin-like protein